MRAFIIDKYNTWYDWRLTLTAKDVTPAEPKYNYVELDGVSGTLDMTEALTGKVEYTDAVISASFWTSEGTYTEREAIYNQIVRELHGKKVRIIEPDDPEHFYLGRIKVIPTEKHEVYRAFTLEAVCDPWRYAINETARSVTVSGTETAVVIHNNGAQMICPTLEVTSGTVTVGFGGATTSLPSGTYRIPDIKLRPGVNVIDVSGSGAVTFHYREATI